MDLVQIQERISLLSKEMEETKFTVESEKRSMNEDEKKRIDEILAEIDALGVKADEIDREERMSASLQRIKEVRRKAPPADLLKHDTKKGFRNLGEFLTSVYHAGIGGAVDPRLYQSRAATGLGESVPTDGGLA